MFSLQDRISDTALPPGVRQKLTRNLKDIEKTLGESFHTLYENHVIRIIAELRNADCSFFHDSISALKFTNFLAHQFFRTPKLRNLNASLPNPIEGLNLNRTWLIESHIYATNVGAIMFAEKQDYKFQFLKKASHVPFVTSDQPVINLNTHHDKSLRLYYPLTPELAVIFYKDAEATEKIIQACSSIEAEHLNEQMALKSVDQIYASDREYLLTLSRSPTLLESTS